MRPRRHSYRSDYELQVAKNLADRGVKFEYEKHKILYIPKTKTYVPDFYLPNQNIYVEAKGFFSPADRQKMLLVIQQNKELDIRLLFLRASNKLNRSSKTTYSRWCDRHGILWADGQIPDEWVA
jgi:predicted nuclease of restriction endonuclease-like RecB superfamily|tara:strand:- start:84 stop:455 length:372 start_codon:yes stop_codon:yes gene_type:complete